MLSYEERVKTFVENDWPKTNYGCKPELMAISGFICKSKDGEHIAMCVFCKKYLEGWTEGDVPTKEHYLHKKTCKIFHLNAKRSLKALFFRHPKTEFYSSLGFVRYDLKKDVPFIFCYKCGSVDTGHVCIFKDSKYKFSLENGNDFFFNKLILGKYSNTISQYLNYKVVLPTSIKETLLGLSSFNPLDTLQKTLSDYVQSLVDKIEQEMDSDIKKLSNDYK